MIVALAGNLLSDLAGYRVVALLLMVTVSILAMFLDIVPVLVAALLSALIWDYFFIPPRFTFQISSTEDLLLLIMYFLIALINAVLTFKIRQRDKSISHREERENAIRLYNTVLNSLSHELRTPIAAIFGAADSLAQDNGRLSEENKQELIRSITAASMRLNLQVENLLNMSRLESGFIRPKMDWCDLNELIYTVVNRLEHNASLHVLRVQLPENLPLFKLDYGMMDQIIHNLLSNAIIHTPADTIVLIRAECWKCHLRLCITDTGKGFAEADIQQVFDKFYRSPNAPTGGTGLGLSIVKGFVEAQGGTIRLYNKPGGGAEFIIDIPTEVSNVNELKNEDES